jgi:hypothetical protein
MVGPKKEIEGAMGMRYHAKERMIAPHQIEWYFEERDVSLLATSMLLVRVMIGKVESKDRLVSTLRKVPIRQEQAGWNCVGWVKEALEALNADGRALGTSVTEWQAVRNGAMWYVQKKKDEHRFDGQGSFDMRLAATYDLLDGKETVP